MVVVDSEIIVVSGLPRSGTSLMMQMLERGGVEIVSDADRAADLDNPRGYYEFAAVKNLPEDSSWIPTARGKAIKVVSLLLYHLPPAERYRMIFMERDLDEILSSQEAMLMRHDRRSQPRAQILEAYQIHLENLFKWLGEHLSFSVLKVAYSDLIEEPRLQSERIASFLRLPMDVGAMKEAIDPLLYRNRIR